MFFILQEVDFSLSSDSPCTFSAEANEAFLPSLPPFSENKLPNWQPGKLGWRDLRTDAPTDPPVHLGESCLRRNRPPWRADPGDAGGVGWPPGQPSLARAAPTPPEARAAAAPGSRVPFGLEGGRRRRAPRSGKARAAAGARVPLPLLRPRAAGPISARSSPSRILRDLFFLLPLSLSPCLSCCRLGRSSGGAEIPERSGCPNSPGPAAAAGETRNSAPPTR